MDIQNFMEGYKAAWERRDPLAFAALFHMDGQYHNTPFQVQRGKAELVEYWKRVQLQEDVHVSFEVLASGPGFGVAHWHVTYQVASEELFAIWARTPARRRLAADGAGRRPSGEVWGGPLHGGTYLVAQHAAACMKEPAPVHIALDWIASTPRLHSVASCW